MNPVLPVSKISFIYFHGLESVKVNVQRELICVKSAVKSQPRTNQGKGKGCNTP